MYRLAGFALLGSAVAPMLPKLMPLSVYAALLLGTCCLLILVRFWRCLTGLFLFGWFCCFNYQQQQLPERLAGVDTGLRGEVIAVLSESDAMHRFVFAPDKVHTGEGWPARVQLTWYYPVLRPAAGEQWQLVVRARAPRSLLNPGGYDRAKQAYLKGIGAFGYVRESEENRVLRAAGKSLLRDVRRYIAARLGEHLSKGRRSEVALPMVKALLLGERSDFTDDHWRVFRRTGTSHLFAISGLHISLAAGLGLLLGRLLSWRVACVAAFVFAAIYTAISGAGLPAVRALVMLGIALLVLLSRREFRAPDILALAAIVITVIWPLAVFTAGFWLSFAAVWVLIYLAAVERSADSRREGRSVAALLAGPVQWRLVIALSPLVLLWFDEVSLVAPVVNFVLIPCFSFLLVPALLMQLPLLFIDWVAGGSVSTLLLPVDLVAWCLDKAFAVLSVIAASDFAAWQPHSGDTTATLLYLPGAVALVLLPATLPGRALCVFLLLPLVFGVKAVPQEGLRIDVFDVGHGLAVLVRTPEHSLLYDTGPRWRSGDAGERILLPAFRALGVTSIDKLIVSHPDSDHSGGLESLQAQWRQLEPYNCVAGQSWQWEGADFSVLHPAAAYRGSENNASCVVLIRYGDMRLLLAGDVEAAAEYLLVRKGVPEVHWLTVPHHGSATSSTQPFVTATTPQFAVVSAAYANRWGFPREAVVKRWLDAGTCLLNTADTGALRFVVYDDRIRLETYGRSYGSLFAFWSGWWPWQVSAAMGGCSELAGTM